MRAWRQHHHSHFISFLFCNWVVSQGWCIIPGFKHRLLLIDLRVQIFRTSADESEWLAGVDASLPEQQLGSKLGKKRSLVSLTWSIWLVFEMILLVGILLLVQSRTFCGCFLSRHLRFYLSSSNLQTEHLLLSVWRICVIVFYCVPDASESCCALAGKKSTAVINPILQKTMCTRANLTTKKKVSPKLRLSLII